jgi:hypothetical protein
MSSFAAGDAGFYKRVETGEMHNRRWARYAQQEPWAKDAQQGAK